MRLFIVSLALLVAAVLLGGVLLRDTGFVVIGMHGQVVRTSFVFFVVLVILAVLVGLWSWRLLYRLWRAPRDLQSWSKRRQEHKALQALSNGFLALVQGNWRDAERYLSDGARRSETPLLYYLGAARAAQAQKAAERQSFYLQMASGQGDEARLPVLLTQMEATLHEQRLEEAQATLEKLQAIDRNDDQVLRMELAYRRAAREWLPLLELTPKLAKRHLLGEEQRNAIEQEAINGLLTDAEQQREPAAIKTAWKQVSKARRQSPESILRYARALVKGGEHDGAYDLVLGFLKKHWDGQLVRLFGELPSNDPLRHLKTAEGWLPDHGGEPDLLLTLGRLALRNGLWGKARSYLEGLISKAPTPEAYRLLAEAQEQLGDKDAALHCHRQGLLLATGGEPVRALPRG